MGDVGGIQEVLIFFGSLIAGAIAEKLMYAELIKQVYHLDQDPNTKLDTHVSKKSDKPKVEFIKGDTFPESQINDVDMNGLNRKKIVTKIINRKHFLFSFTNMIESIMNCFCFRKYKNKSYYEKKGKKRRVFEPFFRSHFLFNKAMKKVKNNFDSLSLVRSL
jgi:hypothetical protein